VGEGIIKLFGHISGISYKVELIPIGDHPPLAVTLIHYRLYILSIALE